MEVLEKGRYDMGMLLLFLLIFLLRFVIFFFVFEFFSFGSGIGSYSVICLRKNSVKMCKI